VVTLDAPAYARTVLSGDGGGPTEVDPASPEAKHARALRHALAEYELRTYTITPGRPLGEILSA
jgi:hypothetical protein